LNALEYGGDCIRATAAQASGLSQQELDIRRHQMLHTFGNLTLLTQRLNSEISNGPFSKKRLKIAEQSSLRLNTYFRKLKDIDSRDEDRIIARGAELFNTALIIWPRPNM
jgi:hypothetical protein